MKTQVTLSSKSKSAYLLGDFQSYEVYQRFKTWYSVLQGDTEGFGHNIYIYVYNIYSDVCLPGI